MDVNQNSWLLGQDSYWILPIKTDATVELICSIVILWFRRNGVPVWSHIYELGGVYIRPDIIKNECCR
jgi:hypothetical protein